MATVLLGITLASCGSTPELPAVLKEHKDKASFTKINNGAVQLVALFNGNDLTGWYTYTQAHGKNNDVGKAFTVEDGILHFAGASM